MSQTTTPSRAHTKSANVLDTVESFLGRVGATKAGESEKAAEALNEHGSIGGSTTHPVKNVDDGTMEAQTGARFDENTKDNKEDQGAAGVDSSAEQKPGQQDNYQLDIGTNQSATGEDSSVEDDYKGTKDDPGTSTKMTAEDGQKYGEDSSLEDLCKAAAQVGNQLCAAIAAQITPEKEAAYGSDSKPSKKDDKKDSEDGMEYDEKMAMQAGWELAGVVGGELSKEAADQMIHQELCVRIANGEQAAVKVAEAVRQYKESVAAKAANGDEGEEASESDSEGESQGGGGGNTNGDDEGDSESESNTMTADEGMEAEDAAAEDVEEAAAMGGGGPIPEAPAGDMGMGMGGEADILAALAGGENMGAEEAAAGMMDAPIPEGDPAMMGDEMGGGMGEIDPAMLLAALQEAGVTPQEMEVAASVRAKAASVMAKAASQAKGAAGKTKYVPKTAKDEKTFQAIRSYIGELRPIR